MPKKLERELMERAHEKGLTGERANAYVYGTLRETGWHPSTERHGSKHHDDGCTSCTVDTKKHTR